MWIFPIHWCPLLAILIIVMKFSSIADYLCSCVCIEVMGGCDLCWEIERSHTQLHHLNSDNWWIHWVLWLATSCTSKRPSESLATAFFTTEGRHAWQSSGAGKDIKLGTTECHKYPKGTKLDLIFCKSLAQLLEYILSTQTSFFVRFDVNRFQAKSTYIDKTQIFSKISLCACKNYFDTFTVKRFLALFCRSAGLL